MIPKPTHFNQQYASKTLWWSGTDTQERFSQNCINQTNYKKLQELGWLDNKFTYVYNSEGFRDEEFDSRPCAIAIGCSHTEGTGIPVEHTWPSQLQNLLGLKVWNLGIGGAALDTCFRLLEYWINYLNVKYVFCAVPEIARYEIFESNNWSNFVPLGSAPLFLEGYHKNYLAYEENGIVNRRKNLLAMQQICDQKSVELYYDHFENFYISPNARSWHYARDLLHCGPLSSSELAKAFYNKVKEHHAN